MWAALVNRTNGGSAVRYAVAAPGRSFSGARTLAAVGSNTGATPRMAALRGGDGRGDLPRHAPPRTGGVLRYARRAPHGAFGPRARWAATASDRRSGLAGRRRAARVGAGPLTRRALDVASAAARGDPARAGHLRRGPHPLVHAHCVRRRHGLGGLDAARHRGDDGICPPHPREQPVRGRTRPVARDGRLRGPARRARGAGPRSRRGTRAARERVERRARDGAGRRRGDSARRACSTRAASARPRRPPRRLGSTPLVLFTRQIPTPRVCRRRRSPPNPATGEATVLAGAGSIGAPAVAHSRRRGCSWRGGAGRRRRGQHRSLTGTPRPSCCIHERHAAAAAQRPGLRRAQSGPGRHREAARRRVGRRRGGALGVDPGHRARRRAPWP